MMVPQNIKNRSTKRSSNSASGHFYEENKTLTQNVACISKFMAALFTVAKKWKQPKSPS